MPRPNTQARAGKEWPSSRCDLQGVTGPQSGSQGCRFSSMVPAWCGRPGSESRLPDRGRCGQTLRPGARNRPRLEIREENSCTRLAVKQRPTEHHAELLPAECPLEAAATRSSTRSGSVTCLGAIRSGFLKKTCVLLPGLGFSIMLARGHADSMVRQTDGILSLVNFQYLKRGLVG